MEYEDRLRIATPEGVDLELTLAGLGSRLIAALLDTLLKTLVLVAMIVALAATGDPPVGRALLYLGIFCLLFVYDLLFEVLASGRTPGKRWTGLRVVRAGGARIGFVASAIRNMVRLVDFLPVLYGLGSVSILVSARNQRLGDLAADTLVVREHHAPRARAWTTPAASASGDDPLAWDASAVTADELVAVRSFLERRWTLQPGARRHLAMQLTAGLRPRVAGAPADVAPEAFLEGVAKVKSTRG
ncbi:MAG: RDD family protein [Actinomycetota bacterium]|nr:RDD family protein [Actinomycetota bacterium]